MRSGNMRWHRPQTRCTLVMTSTLAASHNLRPCRPAGFSFEMWAAALQGLKWRYCACISLELLPAGPPGSLTHSPAPHQQQCEQTSLAQQCKKLCSCASSSPDHAGPPADRGTRAVSVRAAWWWRARPAVVPPPGWGTAVAPTWWGPSGRGSAASSVVPGCLCMDFMCQVASQLRLRLRAGCYRRTGPPFDQMVMSTAASRTLACCVLMRRPASSLGEADSHLHTLGSMAPVPDKLLFFVHSTR